MTHDDAPRPPDPDPAPARRLDRAPGERYRGMGSPAGPAGAPSGVGGATTPATTAAGGTTRAILSGAGMAGAGAILYALLGEIELGAGMLVVAVFIGWMVGVAIVWGAGAARPIPRQRLVAVILGAGAILAGLLLATALARLEGGVLGPLEYANERYGPIAWVEVALAGVTALVRAR